MKLRHKFPCRGLLGVNLLELELPVVEDVTVETGACGQSETGGGATALATWLAGARRGDLRQAEAGGGAAAPAGRRA